MPLTLRATMASRFRLGVLLLLCACARPAFAATPGPVATVTTPVASPSPAVPVGNATIAATGAAIPSPVRPSPSPTRALEAVSREHGAPDAGETGAESAPMPPAATARFVQPRVFRTPERAAPRAFVPPQAADVPAADDGLGESAGVPASGLGAGPPVRTGGGLVIFRVTARTAVEGFDLRVGYPRARGSFGTAARPAECNAGTGMLVAANDRGDGELRLLVASAQALPVPLDVFCRFATEPGAGIAAGDLTVRVAEVTSDGKRADAGLLLVDVVVR